jgi:hypothetical protein
MANELAAVFERYGEWYIGYCPQDDRRLQIRNSG